MASADASPCYISPILALPVVWLPVIASGRAVRAIVRNERHPQPEHRRAFKSAMIWWFLLTVVALYAALASFDVQIYIGDCPRFKPGVKFIGSSLN